jgi:hypothetical protein
MKLVEYISRSTLKREYAMFLTLWLLGVATYLLLTEITDMQFRVLELFAYPILIGAFGVFGLDWAAKQTNLAGPPVNTETTHTLEVEPGKATQTVTSEQKT